MAGLGALRRGVRSKRVGALALLGFLLFVSLAYLLGNRGERPRDPNWERIKNQGLIRVGMDATYPPFEFWEGGELRGYDVDLARELALAFGVKAEFVDITFDGLYDALLVGRIDVIISALPYDPLMTQDVAYSYSYFNAGPVLVVREGEGAVQEVRQLRGKRVGVELGSAGDLEARRWEERIGLLRHAYITPQETLGALSTGEVDAAIVDAVSVYHFMSQEGGVGIVGEPLSDESYVIAVPFKSPILVTKINQTILGWKQDGFLQALRERWL